jgi:starch phosphorylase
VSDDTLYVGQTAEVSAKVFLADIPAEYVRLEISLGPLGQDNSFASRQLLPMTMDGQPENGWQRYKGSVNAVEAGRFGFTVRALPVHPLLTTPHSLGLLRWAE